MKKQWSPEIVTVKGLELDDEVYKQKIEELAEIIYDGFCELHKSVSVEPELIEKAG